ncbi:radical SAM protein [Streptomyces sp. Ru62]|uniref:radical SAM protein n=1 Tax=Streptomyces sp. Ru62 TaxID=2080745 RepID=UPI0011B0423F|nr:hypothetical protein [Streptomyces sp. Ru62]
MTAVLEPPTETSPGSVSFLELEITGKCQLTCPSLYYAKAGPAEGHGSMTSGDWRRLISKVAAIGVRKVQFIGGEPTMHPDFESLVHRAWSSGSTCRSAATSTASATSTGRCSSARRRDVTAGEAGVWVGRPRGDRAGDDSPQRSPSLLQE